MIVEEVFEVVLFSELNSAWEDLLVCILFSVNPAHVISGRSFPRQLFSYKLFKFGEFSPVHISSEESDSEAVRPDSLVFLFALLRTSGGVKFCFRF